MRVIWGGTFDPVHGGHIELANQLIHILNADKLYLMPCYNAVHKSNVAASPDQRLDMLNLAIKKYPNLCIDKREINKKSASYTYDSLLELREEIGSESLCFVMGTDALISFPEWYRAKEMYKLANFIIVQRPTSSFSKSEEKTVLSNKQYVSSLYEMGFSALDNPKELKNYEHGKVLQLELMNMDISSTNIRSLVKIHKSITHLVGYDVDHYIRAHHLYSK